MKPIWLEYIKRQKCIEVNLNLDGGGFLTLNEKDHHEFWIYTLI